MNGSHLFQVDDLWVAVVASPRGIRRLSLSRNPQQAWEAVQGMAGGQPSGGVGLDAVEGAVRAYFAGDVYALDTLPLDIEDAPPFFRLVWTLCRTIPPGETRSYGWLAERAGRPRASRAVGQAMARNRVALVVPCHRVVASDGSLHGYGGGLDIKERLLNLERDAVARRTTVPGPAVPP